MLKSVSRRDFLRVASLGASGVLLAACAPKVVEVTKLVERVVKETVIIEGEVKTIEKVVKETVVVERIVEKEAAASKEKIVRILQSSWAVGEIPFDRTAREFSAANDGVTVKVETKGEGWDTKLIAQIADGSIEWCALGINTPFIAMRQWVKTGMIQPMDDYIAASTVEGADAMLPDMIDVIREDGSYEGKFYSLPYSWENITFNWRVDYFNAVGVTEAPATYEDWLEACLELKKWGAAEDIYPTSFAGGLHTDAWAILAGKMDNCYLDSGLLRWDSPEMEETLAFMYKMIVEEELTPPHGSDGWLDAYYSGKVASVQAQSSRGVWGQNAFGTDKVATSNVATKAKGYVGSGTVVWGNGTSLINKAPYAQEAMDYLIYTIGPQNVGFHKIVIKTGKTPVFESIYSDVIATDPQFRTYQWMLGELENARQSLVCPRTCEFSIQHSAYKKHVVPFLEKDAGVSPKECALAIWKDVQEEVAKVKL
jgi:ABC-type glycerol-3-phosphate transport system substrate-binding protein